MAKKNIRIICPYKKNRGGKEGMIEERADSKGEDNQNG
jgi:hypothetical protein